MTVSSVHCEARKIAYRQSKDGLVISFVIHPNDMPDALAVAPLGQRYMLALAAIGDDEKPVPEVAKAPYGYCPKCGALGKFRERRPNGDDQCTNGHKYPSKDALSEPSVRSTASERGKAAYAAASDMEKARLRSVLLAKDARFWAWAPLPPEHQWMMSEEMAAQYIRDTCCAGESRRLIAEDRACYEAFIKMETTYMIETNQMAAPR